MTTPIPIYTAIIYKCGCISENDISTGYEPKNFCEVCHESISKVLMRDTHAGLMEVISKYGEAD